MAIYKELKGCYSLSKYLREIPLNLNTASCSMWRAATFDYIRERGQKQGAVNKDGSEESNSFWFDFSTTGHRQPRFCPVLGAAGVHKHSLGGGGCKLQHGFILKCCLIWLGSGMETRRRFYQGLQSWSHPMR